MRVPVYKQGNYLLAALQPAPSDDELLELRETLAAQVGEFRSQGVVVDVSMLDVMDITGVPNVDSKAANHLVQTVEAARLMGASLIVTGLSAEVAQTLVTIGVDLSKINAVGDLQSGLEEAERLLGYKVVPDAAARSAQPDS